MKTFIFKIKGEFLLFVATACVVGMGLSPFALSQEFESEEDVYQALLEEIQPYVRTLSRDIYTYHFENNSSISETYVEPSDAKKVGRINRDIHENLWDPDVPKDDKGWFGAGVYTSANPLASRGYGTEIDEKTKERVDRWVLFQVVLRKGRKILDIVPSTQKEFNGLATITLDTQKGMRKYLSCSAISLLSIAQQHTSVGCRKVFKEIALRLKISAMMYLWSVKIPVEDNPQKQELLKKICPGNKDLAFYLTSFNGFTTNEVQFFTKVPPPSGTDSANASRSQIEIFYRTFFSRKTSDVSGVFFDMTAKSLWPEMNVQVSDDELAQFAQEKLIGCGSYPEDQRNPEVEALEAKVFEESKKYQTFKKELSDKMIQVLKENNFWAKPHSYVFPSYLPSTASWVYEGACQQEIDRIKTSEFYPMILKKNVESPYFDAAGFLDQSKTEACKELATQASDENKENTNKAKEVYAQVSKSLKDQKDWRYGVSLANTNFNLSAACMVPAGIQLKKILKEQKELNPTGVFIDSVHVKNTWAQQLCDQVWQEKVKEADLNKELKDTTYTRFETAIVKDKFVFNGTSDWNKKYVCEDWAYTWLFTEFDDPKWDKPFKAYPWYSNETQSEYTYYWNRKESVLYLWAVEFCKTHLGKESKK